jgi:hypothetical protein
VGKSHIAAAIAHDASAQGVRVFFLLVERLLDHLRATYDDSEVSANELATLVVEADLLVLDDLQNARVRPWARAGLQVARSTLCAQGGHRGDHQPDERGARRAGAAQWARRPRGGSHGSG